MRRLMLALVGAIVLAGVVAAPPAQAHPLGNFTINHLTEVAISSDEVRLRYILDEAEIPTFQQRKLAPEVLLDQKRAEALRGLRLMVDGGEVELRAQSPGRIARPAGEGGLETTRVELDLVASVDDPQRVELRNDTFPDRPGWKAIVVAPGEGTAVRSSAPSQDVTNGLRSYPEAVLDSPAEQRSASFDVAPGDGSVVAPALSIAPRRRAWAQR